MNREILFRGQQAVNGNWKYGYYVKLSDGKKESHRIYTGYGEIDCGDYYPDWFEVDPETIGQWTGLTDKNGKKIFDGDIVLKRTYNRKKKFPVSFDGGMFYCGIGGGSSTPTHRYTLEDSQIEVIGNIHDNSELLEGN